MYRVYTLRQPEAVHCVHSSPRGVHTAHQHTGTHVNLSWYTNLRDRSRVRGKQSLSVASVVLWLERGHTLRHTVGQYELFPQFDICATFGCIRMISTTTTTIYNRRNTEFRIEIGAHA